ncbi:hypothetical protein SELMODRAFT_227886 [Selaginella moellendorffii]|uniref:TMPIT-like protein n=1 Tax=Selaginella moellendorffii TaxID=88036 RepID=D8RE29_SELML|nr:transmembrane protein 120 homolog [Selaginella moellendorffii]EFJ29366.1 hypothetical protein SELMODRAFT_227886 [Selaginella moellendorffii]|eukprot:XP_002969278.1 transmembrane protein 120 homolog [Selaginella moellendorffii]
MGEAGIAAGGAPVDELTQDGMAPPHSNSNSLPDSDSNSNTGCAANRSYRCELPAEKEIVARIGSFVERCKKLQDEASVHSSRIRAEAQVLSQHALAYDAEIKSLKGEIAALLEKDMVGNHLVEKLDDDLYRARSMIYEGDVAALLPHKSNGLFLRLLLGPVNVRATRNDARFKVKEEYNTYRDRTAVLFLAFPCVLLLLKNFLWSGCFPAVPVQAYQAWLLFFYTSLALRENILRVNGSDIRPWWVYHHYFAMVTALVSLTWGIQGHPSCVRKQEAVRHFLSWAAMQGVSMLLQNRYQRQRLYTRIALGKAGRMDVVWGETAGMKGQIWVLYPLLFILQAFQFFIGFKLLKTPMVDKDYDWQMVACGVLLIVMAVGNFANTMATVATKVKVKSRMKRKLQRMSSKTS